jgi:hypothetical protein
MNFCNFERFPFWWLFQFAQLSLATERISFGVLQVRILALLATESIEQGRMLLFLHRSEFP